MHAPWWLCFTMVHDGFNGVGRRPQKEQFQIRNLFLTAYIFFKVLAAMFSVDKNILECLECQTD